MPGGPGTAGGRCGVLKRISSEPPREGRARAAKWPGETVVKVADVNQLVKLLSTKRLAQYSTMTWRGVAAHE